MKGLLLFFIIFISAFNILAKNISADSTSYKYSTVITDTIEVNLPKEITAKDISRLPVRDFKNIIELTPGVILNNNIIYMRGSRGDETGYILDGIDIRNKLTGKRNITIVPDAISKIGFNTGGHGVNYGGSSGGIINTHLKTGTSKLKFTIEYVTDNLNFQSKNNRFNSEKFIGTHSYGYNEFTATASGPFLNNKIKFFALFNSNWKLDKNPRPFPGINLGTITDNLSFTPETNSITLNYPAGPTFRASKQTYTGTGTITFDLNDIKIKAFGTYTHISSDRGGGGNILQILDLNRIGINRGYNAAASVQLTHQLNPTTFYQLNLGFTVSANTAMDPLLQENWMVYGDSVANANVGAVWYRTNQDFVTERMGRYVRPTSYYILGFRFSAPNDVLGSYSYGGFEKYKNEEFSIKGFISKKLDKIHSIKFGGAYSTNIYRSFNVLAPGIAERINSNNQLPESRRVTLKEVFYPLVNSYGYDLFGNEINSDFNTDGNFLDDGVFAPRRPKFGSLFIEDKITYKNVLMKIGLRYDYIDVDNIMPIDPANPQTFIDIFTFKIMPSGFKKSPIFSTLSPRLSLSYSLPNNYVLHSQFGRYIQQSRLSDIYNGLNSNILDFYTSVVLPLAKAWYLEPVKTTQFEIGFTKYISDFASFDITTYFKNITDLVVFAFQKTEIGTPFGDYSTFVNGESAIAKGIDISFYLQRTKRLQVNALFSLQSTSGTGSDSYSQLLNNNFFKDGNLSLEPRLNTPLDYNREITGNINFDYRFSNDESSDILKNLGLNLLFTFASGHPYTLSEGKGDRYGTLESNPRFRTPVEELNSSRTPWIYQVNLRMDKTFNILDKLRANVYLYIINLFDRVNIQNVFIRTGSPFDDGFLSDPTLGGTLHPAQRQDYENLYRAINIDYFQNYLRTTGNSLFGQPRQIRFGIRLEY